MACLGGSLMKKIKKPLIYVFAIGLIYYAFSTLYLVIATSFVTISIFRTYGTIDAEMLAQAVVDQVFISTLFAQISTLLLCLTLLYKEKLKSFLNFKKTPIKLIVFSFFAGISMVFVSTNIINLLESIFPRLTEDSLSELNDLININSWLMFIPVVLMAPIVEEILYRGILFRAFKKEGVKSVWVILMSGLIFGIIHLNFVQSTYAAVLGVIMALAYYWTKNILVPIIMHFGNNLLAVILTFDIVDDIITSNYSLYQSFGLFMMAIVLPLMMILLFIYRDREKEEMIEIEFRLNDDFIYTKDIPKFRLNIMFSVMIIFISIATSFIKGFMFMSIFAVPAIFWIGYKWYKVKPKNKFKDLYEKYISTNKLSHFVLAIEKLELEPLSTKNLALSKILNAKVWAFYQIDRSKKILEEIENSNELIEYYLVLTLIHLIEKDVPGYESSFRIIKNTSHRQHYKDVASFILLLEIAYKIHVLDQPDTRIFRMSKEKTIPKVFYYYLVCKHYHLTKEIAQKNTYLRYTNMHIKEMEQLKPYLNALF
jgi:membrane protease YdiL (CAAX protease family)